MKNLILTLALLCAAPVALAHDVRVQWLNATTYTDGSLISNGVGDNEVVSTQVQYGTCSSTGGFGSQLGAMSVPFAARMADFSGLSDGRFCFRARHGTLGGTMGVWSQVAETTLVPPPSALKPRRPRTITISVLP